MSVCHGWGLWSLDISTAFLQGFTFDQLRSAGYSRQPVAFKAPSGTLDILGKLSPLFKNHGTMIDPCIEILKGAYG